MQKATLIERIQELTIPLDPLPSDRSLRLSPLSDITCVAFDFYGTMFISGVGDIGIDEEQESSSGQIFIEALVDSGLTSITESAGKTGLEFFERGVHQTIRQKQDSGIDYPEPDIINVWQQVLTDLEKKQHIEGLVSRETAMRFCIEFEFRINSIWPTPDLAPILTRLLDRDITLGIISNSQFYTPLAFEALIGKSPSAFGFDKDLQIWSYAAGVKKPSVSLYQLFVDQLPAKNIAPDEVLYVGNDLFKDVEPANKLGMKTALFVGDRRSIRHEDAELGANSNRRPDLIINDLRQIIECLE